MTLRKKQFFKNYRLANAITPGLAAIAAATVVSGCQSPISVPADNKLVSRSVTEGTPEAIYPDHAPAIPDGKMVWDQLSCAECHGADGKGVAGKGGIDLTNKELMGTKKPVDQYMFLLFGQPGRNHPKISDRVTRQQAWNLVFYCRSLSTPFLSQAEFDAIKPVFGANCAVCHGTKGYGDGPLAKYAVLEPNPANFQNFKRFYDRSDDTLYDHIANGIKWEGMPNFLNKEDKAKGVKFDEAYIRKLVAFVRSFHSTNVATLAEAKVEPAGNAVK
ncbi:MAG TPA: c-type cytochrome [Candidatus Obscuribacterales bacterium]